MSEYQYEEPVETTASVCVVGLGYVGLPLAAALDAAGNSVTGFDVDPDKVDTLESGVDPTGDVGDAAIAEGGIEYTTDSADIANAEFVIVAVPTPVDDNEKPNLGIVEGAAKTVGENMTDGTTVVLESTVYPGATQEVFVPALEEASGMTAGEEFDVGYSPERMVPGDTEHGLANVVKIVSALTDEGRDELVELYGTVVDAGLHEAPTIETAEAAKCVENTQRDVNIALMNELAMVCDELGLETEAVLEAAGTKWNFHEYEPGLVGGHCIPVDPFYLLYQSEREGVDPELIRTSREVNESVSDHLADMTIRALNESEKVPKNSRVLVAGLAYKPDVDDIRTSKIGQVIEELQGYGIEVVGFDPHADPEATREAFDIEIQDAFDVTDFDGLVIGTPHSEFQSLSPATLADQMADDPVMIDIDGTFEDAAELFTYRRL
ncbi:nucleotide sugar dehydrogenase [Natronococcus amylolyticus DSM 10524]|uniref:UDP-N-acetyl-D-mannosamine dehydrogenase n=1 Tax=Natronococcus amylolyticus DSM 10524 TaxID=1227497 RepID=L9WZY8_9EURY|nr:nucleotide sugar dehydrogenase [Natronococcus amylolyticus]ELY54957.1 nucleotide sugar dehydrogenase [Natronococcus amylolyticus DSM 10524]